MSQSEATPDRKKKTNAAFGARVNVFRGNHNFTDSNTENDMKMVKVILAIAADKLRDLFETADKCDVGQGIAALDALRDVQIKAWAALSLPYTPAD